MKKNLLLSVGALLSLNVCYAEGQGMAEALRDSVRSLDEVFVTATTKRQLQLNKLPVPADKLPVTLNVISGSSLLRRNINSLESALKLAPGVNVHTTYGGFNEISIRGFNHSILMVDGVRDERSSISNSYPTGDITQVESIEVLKGPASALYGYSVVGGIVNVSRKLPEERTNLALRMGYGSFGHHELGAQGGGRIADGLSFYVGGFYSAGEGWRQTNDKRRSAYLAMQYQKGAHRLVLRSGLRSDFYGTEMGLPPLMPETIYRSSDGGLEASQYEMRKGIDRSWRYNNDSDYLKNKAADVSLQYTWSFAPSWKLKNTASYTFDDIDYFSTEVGSYRKSEDPIYPYYSVGKDGAKTYWDLDNLIQDQNLRFNHVNKALNDQLDLTGRFLTGSIAHNILVGVNVSYIHRVSYTGYNEDDVWGPGVGALVPTFAPKSGGALHTKLSRARIGNTLSYGFHASDVVEFLPQLRAMLSFRYDHFDYRYASVPVKDGKHGFDMPASDKFGKTRASALSYRTGLVYNPIQSLSIFGSLGNFYIPDRTLSLSPSEEYYDSKGNQITSISKGHVFEPTTGYQWEVGVKYNVDDRISLLLSYFDSERSGEVLGLGYVERPNPSGNPPTIRKEILAQVGKTRSKGVEAELKVSPVKGLVMMFGYGYTHARVAEMAESALTRQFPSTSAGSRFRYIPDHTFSTYGTYRFAGALQGLSANYSITYRSKLYTADLSEALTLPSELLVNLGVDYDFGKHYSVGVQIKNLFNHQGYYSTLGSQRFPNAPTNFMVSIGYKL